MDLVNLDSLYKIARESLLANIVETELGSMLAAGSHQFKTLWTRDFCFSVPGLLKVGKADLVRRQIELYLSFQRPDLLVPRGVDVVPPQLRVVLNSVGRFLPRYFKDISYKGRTLNPEFLGEHRTVAFDSNILLLLASLQYTEGTNDKSWFYNNKGRLLSLLDYYKQYQDADGFFIQPPFSDWQDSTRRSGRGLYFHVLYLKVLKKLISVGILNMGSVEYSHIEDRFAGYFFNPEVGLFIQDVGVMQVPLESNLWILEENLFSRSSTVKDLKDRLLGHPLWSDLGVPLWPPSPDQEVSWTTKWVGLRGYHDSLRWSWLLAEAARVMYLIGKVEESARVIRSIENLVQNNGVVNEVYEFRLNREFRTTFYVSEAPFSWGAAKLIEALGTLESKKRKK